MNKILIIVFLILSSMGVTMAEKNKYGFEKFLNEIPIKISDGYYYYKFYTTKKDKVTPPKDVLEKEIIPKIELIKKIISQKKYEELRTLLYKGRLPEEAMEFYSRESKKKLSEAEAFNAMMNFNGLASGEFLNFRGLKRYGEKIHRKGIIVIIVEYLEDLTYIDPYEYEKEIYCVEFFDLSGNPILKDVNGFPRSYIPGKLCLRKKIKDKKYYFFGRDDINGHNLVFDYTRFLYEMILRDNYKALILDEERW